MWDVLKKYLSNTQNLVRRENVQLTFVYAACFGVLGCVMSGMGPSLPELGRKTRSTDPQMGWILTIRAFGYLTGSMGGPLFDRFKGNLVLAIAMIVCSISCASMGFIREYWLLLIVVPFQGICMGLLDTGGNVMTLWLHDEDVEPYMQALHFMFATGGLLSPFMISQTAKEMNGSITISWCIIAALFVPIVYFLLRYESPKDRHKGEDGISTVKYEGWSAGVLVLTAAFLFFDIGAEASIATFLVTYIIRRDLLDETSATLVNSAFWAFMVVGRLIAIPVSLFVKSHWILTSTSVLSILATGLMAIFHESVPILWISSITYGLGMSVAFTTGVLLAQYYIPITGRAGTILVVGAASGELMIPAVIAQLFPLTQYLSLPYTLFGASIVCLLITLCTIYVGEQTRKTQPSATSTDLSPTTVNNCDNISSHTTEETSEADIPTPFNIGTSDKVMLDLPVDQDDSRGIDDHATVELDI